MTLIGLKAVQENLGLPMEFGGVVGTVGLAVRRFAAVDEVEVNNLVSFDAVLPPRLGSASPH